MKRTIKLLSFALSLIMILGMIPFAAFATENTPENDGDLLYTVNFNGDDVYDNTYTSISTAGVAKVSDDGSVLTFSEKTTGAQDYYGGRLKDYRIKGNVYTISYYVENAQLSSYRVAVQLYSNSETDNEHLLRMGFANALSETEMCAITTATFDTNFQLRGGYDNVRSSYSAARYTDANSRQYFKVVVDGVGNISTLYTQTDAAGTYAYVGEIPFNPLTNYDYLSIGMFGYDTLAEGASVSLGNVQIFKGDKVNSGNSAYQTKYDSTPYGGTLIDVNFADGNSAGIKWGDFCNYSRSTVSSDGTSVSLSTNKNAKHYRSAYMPDGAEMANYGNFTYEFYVNSTVPNNGRVAIGVYGQQISGKGYYGAGFAYFYDNNNFFLPTETLTNENNTNFSANHDSNIGMTATKVNGTTHPDTTDSSKPNVKIEFNTVNRTITNYVLNNGSWVKTAYLTISDYNFLGVPIVYLYSYNNSTGTDITFKDFKIVKGLTASDPEGTGQTKYVGFNVDGEYATGYKNVKDITAFPVEAKPFHSMTIKANGKVVTSVEELELNAGFNFVDLTVEYTPVPVPEGLEIRGYQTSVTPTETATAVRFIGALDNITDYSYVGYLVSVVWKDSNGEIHVGEKTVDKNTSTVYTSILANGKDGCKQITAEELGVQYIVAIAIDGVPIGEGVQVDFTVTPYTVAKGEAPALDGSNYTKYDTNTYSFVNGKFDKDAVKLTPPAAEN